MSHNKALRHQRHNEHQQRPGSKRVTGYSRLKHAKGAMQKHCPTWVGRRRYRIGIRARHPWRELSLKAILELRPQNFEEPDRGDLKAIHRYLQK